MYFRIKVLVGGHNSREYLHNHLTHCKSENNNTRIASDDSLRSLNCEMTERVCHSFCAGATTRVAKRDSVDIDNNEKTKHYYKTKEFAHHIYKLNLHLEECATKGEV